MYLPPSKLYREKGWKSRKKTRKIEAAMRIDVRRRVTKPMDIFRVNLWHGASSHNRNSNSRINRKVRDLP